MSIVKNDELYKLNDKIKDIDPGTLSTLGQNNQASLDILLSRVGGVMSSVGADKWNSSVRDVIQKYLDGSFKDAISKARQSSQLVADGSSLVSNLKTAAGDYVKKFDEYTTEKGKSVTQYVEGSTTEYTQEYVNWQSSIRAYERALPGLEEEVLSVIKAVKSYFSAVDFETNTVGASYVAGSADLKYNFDEVYIKELAAIDEEKSKIVTHDPETATDDTGKSVTVTTTEKDITYTDGTKKESTKTETSVKTSDGTEILKIDEEQGDIKHTDGHSETFDDFERTSNDGTSYTTSTSLQVNGDDGSVTEVAAKQESYDPESGKVNYYNEVAYEFDAQGIGAVSYLDGGSSCQWVLKEQDGKIVEEYVVDGQVKETHERNSYGTVTFNIEIKNQATGAVERKRTITVPRDSTAGEVAIRKVLDAELYSHDSNGSGQWVQLVNDELPDIYGGGSFNCDAYSISFDHGNDKKGEYTIDSDGKLQRDTSKQENKDT